MKETLNSGHYLEMMDRLHVTMQNMEANLLDHPVAHADTRIKSLLEKCFDNLWDAYQIAGSLDYERNQPKK